METTILLLVSAAAVTLAIRYRDPEHRAAAAAPFRNKTALAVGGSVVVVLAGIEVVRGERDVVGYLPMLALGALAAALVGRADVQRRSAGD
ncbi:hypothetical protein [Modestobacter sp. SYSU DS0875]